MNQSIDFWRIPVGISRRQIHTMSGCAAAEHTWGIHLPGIPTISSSTQLFRIFPFCHGKLSHFMHYRLLSFAHSTFLADLVHDMYELRTVDQAHTYSTVPNGIIGLSVILEGHSQNYYQQQWVPTPEVAVYGLVRKPGLLKISPNFREIAIGFKPYFLQLFVAESMSQLAGGTNTDARHLFNAFDIEQFRDQLYKAESDREIITAIEAFFKAQFKSHKQNNRLQAAMNLIYSRQNETVQSLSHRLNISSTSLRTLFKDGIGQSPKEVMNILRIYQALHSNVNQFDHLTALGLSLGYFDQAHFVHDFQKVLGMSPRQYFSNDSLTFDFYNYGRWQGNIFAQK